MLKPNAPGRDPIVSRILWLKGMESSNRNAFNRFIYIHGTPEENRLGTPASYGCVRMGMKDVCELFNSVDVGAKVVITKGHLPPGAQEPPPGAASSTADDGSPALGPPPDAQPIEIAKIVPTEAERKRAEENEAKASSKSGSGKSHPPPPPSSRPSKSKTKADTKVAGKASAKAKDRA